MINDYERRNKIIEQQIARIKINKAKADFCLEQIKEAEAIIERMQVANNE